MTAVTAILLDADGVVQLPESGWIESVKALCGNPPRVEAFLADVFAAEKPCTTGHRDFQTTLELVLRKWQSNTTIQEALSVWTQINPSVAMVELVGSLGSAGFKTALATNQQGYRAEFMTNILGYAEHFDELLYSCELGYAKPDSAYFSSAMAKLKIKPESALFIDDHEANVNAARKSGLQAEVYHISEGKERIRELLSKHGVDVA